MKIETELKPSTKLPIDGARVFAYVITPHGNIWKKAVFDEHDGVFEVDYGFISYPIIDKVKTTGVLEWYYYSDEPPAVKPV